MSVSNFNLKDLTITTNSYNELVLSNTSVSNKISQVLPVPVSYVVMYDVVIKQFYAVPIDRHNLNDQFVRIT